ncbi:MAG: dihydroneopterin aldolase [Halocynthiibacter sp.]
MTEMSSKARPAILQLEDRLETEGDPRDRILLSDYITSVEIGAFQVERGIEQRLKFNIAVAVAPHDGAASDDVDDILSYDTLKNAVQFELKAERLNLLETLAERIADRILREDQAQKVILRIEKLDRGDGDLGVEMVREKGGTRVETSDRDILSGREIWCFSKADLPALKNAATARALIAVDQNVAVEGAVNDPLARAQVALLTLDQAAWRLKSVLPDAQVVSTRTELIWALGQTAPVIWAPSKLAIDTDGFLDLSRSEVSGVALAEMLKAEFGAAAVLKKGTS